MFTRCKDCASESRMEHAPIMPNAACFAILIANIDKKNESSKLLGEKLLIEPYTWENCQKGFSNAVQYSWSNRKYSKSF